MLSTRRHCHSYTPETHSFSIHLSVLRNLIVTVLKGVMKFLALQLGSGFVMLRMGDWIGYDPWFCMLGVVAFRSWVTKRRLSTHGELSGVRFSCRSLSNITPLGFPALEKLTLDFSDWELTAAELDSLSVSVLMKDCEEVISKDPWCSWVEKTFFLYSCEYMQILISASYNRPSRNSTSLVA